VNRSIACVSLVVRDYDEAIAFYTGPLGFRLVEDTRISDSKRWVVVAPQEAGGTGLVLAKAANPRQQGRIGDQTGGRVGFFLHTDDFVRDHGAMKSRGVRFVEEPRTEPYGTVAIFEDLYGNRWDLLEMNAPGAAQP
jgi:catechol 2,3-dioxygenase-like lactoylglutathione lyase family enzyme